MTSIFFAVVGGIALIPVALDMYNAGWRGPPSTQLMNLLAIIPAAALIQSAMYIYPAISLAWAIMYVVALVSFFRLGGKRIESMSISIPVIFILIIVSAPVFMVEHDSHPVGQRTDSGTTDIPSAPPPK